jgi:hypothetical protein
MRYIPGLTFFIKKAKLSGTVKNYFLTGKYYTLYNISFKDDKIVYIFDDGTVKFSLSFNDRKEAEGMIDYLTTQ